MVLKDERLQQILSDIDASKDPEKVRVMPSLVRLSPGRPSSAPLGSELAVPAPCTCRPQFLEQKLSKDPAFEAFADQVLKSLQVQP